MAEPLTTTTPYEVVYDAALDKLTGYVLDGLTQEQVYQVLGVYLRPAIVKFRVCTHLKDRDDVLEQFNTVLSDEEIEILACGIAIDYISAEYINTPLVLKQNLSSRDFAVFSDGVKLMRLTEYHVQLKKELEQLISQYSWSTNPSIFKKVDTGGDG